MGAKPSRSEAHWAEAAKRCRLDAETVRMAKELGLNPRKLIKNRPSPSQPWKAPVHQWIQDLYTERQQKSAKTAAKKAVAGGAVPSPLHPEPQPVRAPAALWGLFDEDLDEEALDSEFDENWSADRRPGPDEIEAQDQAMLRRQAIFREAAERVAQAQAEFDAVHKVALFGSVAVPLVKEIPRFVEFRRHRIAVYHECSDVDLAVWVDTVEGLEALRKTRSRVVGRLVEEIGGGLAHHHVEIFLLDWVSGRYLGRLCTFAQCPKGKIDCETEGCGQPAFLKQISEFTLWPDALAPERTVVLFERRAGDAT
ncbi:MAG: nucleotidyltransferase domain-containing protein [Deferrisomatales bacterium]|nr:nucleotidyltransferase domain-containing protein [Deferrisomatales bacterium]